MTKTHALLACLLTGTSLTLAQSYDTTPSTPPSAVSEMGETLRTTVDKSTQDQIRKTLEKVVESGVTRNHFDNLISYLSTEDRDRIGNFADNNFPDMEGRINQFRKDWRSKYNQTFSINRDRVFDQAIITQGPDKRHATVTLPGSADQSPVTLQMVNEGKVFNDWRINIPDQLTGQQIKDQLLNNLTQLDEQRANWSTDANQAYHSVAYSILSALSVPQSRMNLPGMLNH